MCCCAGRQPADPLFNGDAGIIASELEVVLFASSILDDPARNAQAACSPFSRHADLEGTILMQRRGQGVATSMSGRLT